jgi:hypothetical protein
MDKLPTALAYGNAAAEGAKADSIVGRGLTTVKDIVTGKLPANYIVNSSLCQSNVVKPIAGFAGRRVEIYIDSYKEGEKLQNLVEGIVDKVITPEMVEKLCKLALRQIMNIGIKPCIGYIQNDTGLVGKIGEKVYNCTMTGLEGATKACEKISSAYDTVAKSSVGTILKPMGSILNTISSLIPEKEEEEEPLFQEIRKTIKPLVVEALKPIAQWGIEKAARQSKPAAEKMAQEAANWTLKKIVQIPFQAASLAAVTSFFAELSPQVMLACTAAPIVYSAGSAIKNCITVYYKREQEAGQRDELAEIFEKQIVKQITKAFGGGNIEKTVKEIANPLAINLAEYIMNTISDKNLINCIIDELKDEEDSLIDTNESDVPSLSSYVTKENINHCISKSWDYAKEMKDSYFGTQVKEKEEN